MERLVRLIGVLAAHPKGAPAPLLLRAVGGSAGEEARHRMLSRDLEQLNRLGYDIRNVAESGEDGRYVMRARDNRLQVHLTAEQRGELLRAAVSAGLDRMAGHLGAEAVAAPVAEPGSGALDLVQRATTHRCLVRFVYKGERRTAHPVRVHSGPSGWYLSAREEGSDVVKEFVVARMGEVTLDPPGTSAPVTDAPRPSLDPLGWLLDDPTDVAVELPTEHRLLAENLLGAPVHGEDAGDVVRLTYRVTNRAVFRWRLYELGTRVRVVSPENMRAELLAELDTYLAGPA